ncbi:nitroreductase/quinone reductase family protein [Herbidospora galbida]|uniref:nitroreductase/quinone reductase family protein n=1 Tax=Herbidospora galbida TaxID=2575442 RepID=UPI0014856139
MPDLFFTTESNAADGWAPAPWPEGLVSFEVYESLDATTVLTYSRWTTDGGAFLKDLTGADPTAYHLYRHAADGREPGCVVAVEAEFDAPDPDRLRRWIDTVFDAMAAEDPHPGGISGRFHTSLDGTRMLNLAGWTGAEAHEEALTLRSPAWQRVYDFPGMTSGGFRRYAPIRPRADIESSPTGWVASHVATYVESGGRKGHTYQGKPALLLTTTGRKSGRPRRTALFYGTDGPRHLLVASNGGSPAHPAWYLNLTADPHVTVQVGPEVFTARARTATPEEKRDLWPTMTEIFPLYATYEAKSPRDLPLVILDRTVPGWGS